MNDDLHPRGRLAAILTDPQFWVPLAVLLAGIGVLLWIA